MKLHFISGLPRSGSTLLAALLRQNPRFSAGMSSPVAQLVMRVQHATSMGSEGAVLVSDAQRKRLLRGLFANYYAGAKNWAGEAEVIFDTNRAWCAKMPLLADLFPDSKVICMVRDVPWIMNSVEKLLNSNPAELSGIFGYNANTTIFGRVNGLASADGLVGYAMNALREAFCGQHASKLLLIDYDALVNAPKDVMENIYAFLGEASFKHDFDNFEYEAEEFDLSLGTPGLHKVKGPIVVRQQEMILPMELAQRFAQDSFWRIKEANTKGANVIAWEDSSPIPMPQPPRRPQLVRQQGA